VLHAASGTDTLLPSNCFLCTLILTPTFSQNGRTLTLNETQIQVFNQLQGKLQDIVKAVKAILAARKKGQGKSRTADNANDMDAECFI
jgi:hypothetical protein